MGFERSYCFFRRVCSVVIGGNKLQGDVILREEPFHGSRAFVIADLYDRFYTGVGEFGVDCVVRVY